LEESIEMSIFSYKDIYIEDGQRVLEVNILPEKYCNFDCIFCPIGRSFNKVDTPKSFDGMENALRELENIIQQSNIDLVFINSKGEALVNNQINNIIGLIKGKGLPVRLLSNGYLLGNSEYLKIANMCEEVIGEIKVISEADFQKLQRPIDGYTMEDHISNMIHFNKQFKGKFILEVTILKGYNDTDESIQKIKNVIERISPDRLMIERMNDERFKPKYGISDERLYEISRILLNR
jgi:wyosine [tRNA(Phe)-imidazoG37] synthetase (radical SAM superfamily)